MTPSRESLSPKRAISRAGMLALGLLLPTLMGGCPEFQNEVVNSFEVAMRGVVDAALDLAFNQLRPDEFT